MLYLQLLALFRLGSIFFPSQKRNSVPMDVEFIHIVMLTNSEVKVCNKKRANIEESHNQEITVLVSCIYDVIPVWIRTVYGINSNRLLYRERHVP